MTRPLTLAEREALDRTAANISARLPPPRRYAPKPRLRLRARHAVGFAIAAGLWAVLLWLAAELGRVM